MQLRMQLNNMALSGAEVAKISVRHVHNIYHRKTIPKEKNLTKLTVAGTVLNKASDWGMSVNTKSRRSA